MGTAKLGDGAVTSGKLAASSVTSGKLAASSVTSGAIAPNSVGASQIVDGQVVEGDGKLQQIETTVLVGFGVRILNFPGIGAFESDCGNGQSTTRFSNTTTATNIQVFNLARLPQGLGRPPPRDDRGCDPRGRGELRRHRPSDLDGLSDGPEHQ